MREYKVLFVCLGNICRSPLAEAAFRQQAQAAGYGGLVIDSAGTGNWHVGEMPDPRARAVAKANGAVIDHLRARQVTKTDFDHFTHIVAMDASNLAHLTSLAPRGSGAEISLMFDHVPGMTGQDVADPYYHGSKEFERTWREVTAGARGLLVSLGLVVKA